MNLSLCIAAGLLLPGLSYAACDREDIEYYLGKGFTTSQITALCTHGSAADDVAPATQAAPAPAVQPEKSAAPAKAEPQPSPAPVAAPAPVSTPAGTDEQASSAVAQSYSSNEEFLRTAIDGHDVVLGQNSLTYVLKKCMEAGEEDLFGFASEACPLVKYTVSLNGLDVKTVKKKYTFYGTTVVRVKGRIQRDIVGNFDTLSDDARRYVMEKIDSGPKTDIPIRSGIPVDQVEKVFNEIIK